MPSCFAAPVIRCAALLALLVLALSLACGSDGPSSADADIRGGLTGVTPAEDGGDVAGSVLIDAGLQAETPYVRASVTVKKKTRIFLSRDGRYERVEFDALKVGMLVEARFTGVVEPTDPVRATASEIVILQ
jgi:hypothetical protein